MRYSLFKKFKDGLECKESVVDGVKCKEVRMKVDRNLNDYLEGVDSKGFVHTEYLEVDPSKSAEETVAITFYELGEVLGINPDKIVIKG